jgi:outer membrane protein assembly factor BamB
MHRRAFLVATAGSLSVMSGCLGSSSRPLPESPRGEWAQRSADRRNTSASDVTVPDRGNRAWDLGDAGSIEPLVADGMVYSIGAAATALDARTGELAWDYEFSEQTAATPVLTEDFLVVAAGRRLVALNRDDGSEEWSVDLPRPAERAMTLDPPLLTVPLTGRRDATGLIAFDAGTGDPLWDHSTLAARTTAIDDERVYTTGYRQDGDTGILRALSVAHGSVVWERELDHPDTAPVLAGGEILVADEGTLAVHDKTDGSRQRSLDSFGERINQPPAVWDGVAYVGIDSQEIVAVSLADGSIHWRRDGSAYRGISAGRETVVTSGESLPSKNLAGLAAFDRSDGSVLWEHQIEGFDAFPSTAPVLAEGAVYYSSNDSSGVVALGDLPNEG